MIEGKAKLLENLALAQLAIDWDGEGEDPVADESRRDDVQLAIADAIALIKAGPDVRGEGLESEYLRCRNCSSTSGLFRVANHVALHCVLCDAAYCEPLEASGPFLVGTPCP